MARRWYGRVTRVDVYDSRIDQWYSSRGPVRLHANKIARRGQRYSKDEAPERTGNLKRSIRGEVARRGRRHVVAYVRAYSQHSYFVHEGRDAQFGRKALHGTPGAKSHGKWRPGMEAALTGGKWPKYSQRGVDAQDADPFLERGMARAALDFPDGGVLPPVLRSAVGRLR